MSRPAMISSHSSLSPPKGEDKVSDGAVERRHQIDEHGDDASVELLGRVDAAAHEEARKVSSTPSNSSHLAGVREQQEEAHVAAAHVGMVVLGQDRAQGYASVVLGELGGSFPFPYAGGHCLFP